MSAASQSFRTFGPKKFLLSFFISSILSLKDDMYADAASTSYSAGKGFSQSTFSTPQKISTRIAWWPFWRNAVHIPVPDVIETVRSVLVPPANTTIFIPILLYS